MTGKTAEKLRQDAEELQRAVEAARQVRREVEASLTKARQDAKSASLDALAKNSD